MTAYQLRAVCSALEHRYHNPRHGNKAHPLNELVFIILSTRTRDPAFRNAYRDLKRAYPKWESLTPDEESGIAAILRPYGLANLKAHQLVRIMQALRESFGRPTLAPLKRMSASEGERFLTGLSGVASKVAKCVLMYSLGHQVLPVDVHVHRVAIRLGFDAKKRPDTSQIQLERAIPPSLRYGFHVNAVAHGRAVCLPRSPKCSQCCIARYCQYYRVRRNTHGS